MYAWESIQTVLDYLEKNIAENHSIDELAKMAALSPFYFQRLFRRLIGHPINEYIKLRRLAKASERLTNKDSRILDLALDYGFSDHAHFTKTFKNAFGITPEEYWNQPIRLNQVIKPDLLLNYKTIDENIPLITDDIVLEISKQTLDLPELYIGLSGLVPIAQQMPLEETTGIDVPGQLWNKFHHRKNDIRGKIVDGSEFAVSSMISDKLDSFTYFVGVAAEPDTIAYDDFVIWQLIPAEYIGCTVEAESQEELITYALDKGMNYLFNTWLPNHNIVIEPFSVEKYLSMNSGIYKMQIWVQPMLSTE